MSKRLQVLISDEEMALIKRRAEGEHLPVGQWVRKSLRQVAEQRSSKTYEERMAALEEASKVNAPTCDIDQMLRESEKGYKIDLPGL
ncbi:MAG: hypothetical protein HZC36_03140 [Armatimonadetes bacterium]|nr:hypothetical protein [Armatimonadota bacterium]